MEKEEQNIDSKILLNLPKFLGGKPSVCLTGEELTTLISQEHIQVIDMPVIVEIQTAEEPELRKLYLETLLEIPRGCMFAKLKDLRWHGSQATDLVVGIEPNKKYCIDLANYNHLNQEPPQERGSLDEYMTQAPIIETRKAAAAELAATRQRKKEQRKPAIETLSLSPEMKGLSTIAEEAKLAQKSALPSRFCLVSGSPDQLTITKPVSLTMKEWQEEIEHRVRRYSRHITLLTKILTNPKNIYQVDETWLMNLLGMLDMNKSRINQDIADQIIQRFTPRPNKQISFGFSYQTQINPSPFDEGLKIELLKL